MARHVMHVAQRDDDGLWHIEVDGASIAKFPQEIEAELAAMARGNELLAQGRQCELIVYDTHGVVDRWVPFGYDDLADREGRTRWLAT